jgi:hypothetical protein
MFTLGWRQMQYEYMFLSLIIPGPDRPRPRINVMLKPLIEELKQLWEGVKAYVRNQVVSLLV